MFYTGLRTVSVLAGLQTAVGLEPPVLQARNCIPYPLKAPQIAVRDDHARLRSRRRRGHDHPCPFVDGMAAGSGGSTSSERDAMEDLDGNGYARNDSFIAGSEAIDSGASESSGAAQAGTPPAAEVVDLSPVSA